jgi:transposase
LSVKTAPGASAKIQGEALEKLQVRLKCEEGFGSYGEIMEWLKQECGLEVKYNMLNRFVREKLNGKLKVPRPVSAKQHPQAVETYKKTSAWC